jgi:parallel beta helix pectate lyase-like protein
LSLAKEFPMTRTFKLVATVAALALAAIPLAAGAAQRTFVATAGSDLAACSLAAPCRTFTAATAQTDAGGEIVVLDSGGYGKVTIDKAVSIIAPPGVYAGISAFNFDDGVTIAAGANDKVVLSGLTINGLGGNIGILIQSGGEIHVERCTVANMDISGIRILGGTRVYVRSSVIRGTASNGLYLVQSMSEVHVVDSQFVGNGGTGIRVDAGTLDAQRITAAENAGGGLLAQATALGNSFVTLADSALSGNGVYGVRGSSFVSGATARVAITRSASIRNADDGYFATSGAGGSSVMTVTDSTALENGAKGVQAVGANTTVIVGGSSLAGNVGSDLFQSTSSVLRSSGNNTLTGRGAGDITGTITANPLQ